MQSSADGKEGSSITCTISNNQVWDIEGGYTDANIAPVVSLYLGSTYIQHFTGDQTTKHADISAQLSAQASAQTYTLYNSADNTGPVATQTTCPAKTVTAARQTQKAASDTTTPATTATTTTNAANTDTVAPAQVSPKKNANSTPLSSTLASSDSPSAGVSGAAIAILTIFGLLGLLSIVSCWIVFRKAGRPGWGAIIPVYNIWLMFDMGGRAGWWALLMLIPVVNLIGLVMFALTAMEIAKRFGKGRLFGIFGIFLFGFIGWPYLAFSKAKYSQPLSSATPAQPEAPVSTTV